MKRWLVQPSIRLDQSLNKARIQKSFGLIQLQQEDKRKIDQHAGESLLTRLRMKYGKIRSQTYLSSKSLDLNVITVLGRIFTKAWKYDTPYSYNLPLYHTRSMFRLGRAVVGVIFSRNVVFEEHCNATVCTRSHWISTSLEFILFNILRMQLERSKIIMNKVFYLETVLFCKPLCSISSFRMMNLSKGR